MWDTAATTAYLKSLMSITRDLKDAPPYRYESFVVCGGNTSSCFTPLLSMAQESLATAIMAGPLVPPSLLPSCRVRISKEAGGGKSH